MGETGENEGGLRGGEHYAGWQSGELLFPLTTKYRDTHIVPGWGKGVNNPDFIVR